MSDCPKGVPGICPGLGAGPRRFLTLLFACVFLLQLTVLPAVAGADELQLVFSKVRNLAQKGDYPAALKELEWASVELKKAHRQKLLNFFPEKLGPFAKSESVSGMGYMDDASLQYVRGAGDGSDSVMVSVTSNAGQMAQIVKLSCSPSAPGFGGGGAFRLKGYTAIERSHSFGSSGSSEISVCLKGGSVKFHSFGGKVNAKDLRELVELFNFAPLEKYLAPLQ